MPKSAQNKDKLIFWNKIKGLNYVLINFLKVRDPALI